MTRGPGAAQQHPGRRRSEVWARQAPLRRRYQDEPDAALIIDRGRTLGLDPADAVHTVAIPGEEYQPERVRTLVGTHRGVGGLHDAPNPGEMLCAALAACQDSSIRMVADILDIELTSLAVAVDGHVDLRGTLAMDPAVRVGFRSMRCRTRLTAAPSTDPRRLAALVSAAERSCVVLDTLRQGVSIESTFDTASIATS